MGNDEREMKWVYLLNNVLVNIMFIRRICINIFNENLIVYYDIFE